MSAAPNGAVAWRGALPWWSKIAAKLVLSRLPVSGRTWQRLGLFSPGYMLDPDYAISIFRQHYGHAGRPAPGFRYLELGPGDSLATAVIAWAHGAAAGWLVDAGAYAAWDIAQYRPLFERLETMDLPRSTAALRDCATIEDMLARTNCTYREDGLAGLRVIPTGSLRMVFSQAVLEHVPRHEFTATVAEMHRILAADGTASHQVDFKDHLGGSLHNLRFSDSLWERPWFAARSGFYTNRLRLSEVRTAFETEGFHVEVRDIRLWDRPPLPRDQLAAQFRACSDDDLRTQGALLIATPAKPHG